MRLTFGLVLVLLSAGASAANLPDFDIKSFCGTRLSEEDAGSKLAVEDCVDNERVARIQLQQILGALSDDSVQHCVKSASAGPSGAGSYLALLGCIDQEESKKSTGVAAADDHPDSQPNSASRQSSGPVGAATATPHSSTEASSGAASTESANANAPLPRQFNHDLGLASVDPDVKRLQIFLNAHGFPVAADGPGSSGHEVERFGPSTKAALKRFQKAHAKELGIGSATGHFGPTTRNYVNGL